MRDLPLIRLAFLITTNGTDRTEMTDTFEQRSYHSRRKFNGKAILRSNASLRTDLNHIWYGSRGRKMRKKKRRHSARNVPKMHRGSHSNTKRKKKVYKRQLSHSKYGKRVLNWDNKQEWELKTEKEIKRKRSARHKVRKLWKKRNIPTNNDCISAYKKLIRSSKNKPIKR
eukprot:472533_1